MPSSSAFSALSSKGSAVAGHAEESESLCAPRGHGKLEDRRGSPERSVPPHDHLPVLPEGGVRGVAPEPGREHLRLAVMPLRSHAGRAAASGRGLGRRIGASVCCFLCVEGTHHALNSQSGLNAFPVCAQKVHSVENDLHVLFGVPVETSSVGG